MNLKHISLVSIPVDAPWGRWFGVDDPDGNNWLITQERDGS
jgi:hypothetical protein